MPTQRERTLITYTCRLYTVLVELQVFGSQGQSQIATKQCITFINHIHSGKPAECIVYGFHYTNRSGMKSIAKKTLNISYFTGLSH